MRKLLILPLIAILAACGARTGNMNMSDSKSGIAEQMSELKTKKQLRAALGAPNLVFYNENVENYEYKTIGGEGRYQWLMPIFGYIMSFWQDNYSYDETNLFVRFDKNDNVLDYKVIKTGGTAN
ncbi:MAG: hypothetical protein LBL21_01505 [Rickettsiales bacterium]|nr:hypothetical protein [Rickettsiales bacterium]